MSNEKCEVCDSTEDVRLCPVMTGEPFNSPTRRPVCVLCIRAWYQGGGTTKEEILAIRQVAAPRAPGA